MATHVRFGVLGFGLHGARRLVPAFNRCAEANLEGIWRRNAEARQDDCAKYAIPHCFNSAEELCTSSDIDVVFVTSPDAKHREDVLLALRHGKAVLCEKPMAMNATEAEEMNAAAERSGVLFGVAQNYRYHRSAEWMRERIRSGSIGTPQMAHVQFSSPAWLSPRRWIADSGLACGGPIGDVGVHCIDALRFVLEEEVLSVSTLARRDQLSGELESRAALQLEMTGDVFANVMVSARGKYRTLIEVTGTEGVISAENGLTVDRPVDVIVRQSGDLIEQVTVDNGDSYVRMLEGFAAAYRGQGTYAAPGADGVSNMRVLDAAFKSWRSGAREPVQQSSQERLLDRCGEGAGLAGVR